MTSEAPTFPRRRYRGRMDRPCVALCDAMNALPGILTFECCSGHGKAPMLIFFYATDEQGLFFLTRCVDRRYWKHGADWTIELSVGDLPATLRGRPQDERPTIDPPGGTLPTHYCLTSRGTFAGITNQTTGDKAYAQAADLVENMRAELTSGFAEHYKLDLSRFDVEPRFEETTK